MALTGYKYGATSRSDLDLERGHVQSRAMMKLREARAVIAQMRLDRVRAYASWMLTIYVKALVAAILALLYIIYLHDSCGLNPKSDNIRYGDDNETESSRWWATG